MVSSAYPQCVECYQYDSFQGRRWLPCSRASETPAMDWKGVVPIVVALGATLIALNEAVLDAARQAQA